MAAGSARDPRDAAARYRWAQSQPDEHAARVENGEPLPMSETQRQAFIETSIQQAIRQGAFDDLPGAGKPLEGLGQTHDPDWWIRRKIQTENLTGLGPPALVLRVEHARMEQTLDDLYTEADVREAVEDFNARVIEARRQLLGGPPVVTPTRDVEAEVAAWRQRREARREAAEAQRADQADAGDRRTRRTRRSSRRRASR